MKFFERFIHTDSLLIASIAMAFMAFMIANLEAESIISMLEAPAVATTSGTSK